jgi:hypothetical protein
MSKKSQTEARQQLAALGLNPDAPALDIPAMPERPAPTSKQPVLAPKDVDPHTMPVSEIEFDPALLDQFPSLEGSGMAAASRYVFSLYSSKGKNKDRNRRLHDEIGLFIQRVRRSRETGTTHVKDKVRAGKGGRDLLAYLSEHGIESLDDLEGALKGTK